MDRRNKNENHFYKIKKYSLFEFECRKNNVKILTINLFHNQNKSSLAISSTTQIITRKTKSISHVLGKNLGEFRFN
ncbi:MAG: hypothetical protein CK427_04840 [Leptospira sp.]|nr:MAG: hypothetical protein CK427_04840 [Leptospira sp.]